MAKPGRTWPLLSPSLPLSLPAFCKKRTGKNKAKQNKNDLTFVSVVPHSTQPISPTYPCSPRDADPTAC